MISTGIYPDLIIDDVSDDKLTKQYLFTDQKMHMRVRWPTDAEWIQYVGKLNNTWHTKGIRYSHKVVQPTNRKGVLGGVFWCLTYAFNKFNADAVILIESDVLFCYKWYDTLIQEYNITPDAGIVAGFVCQSGFIPNVLILVTRDLYNKRCMSFNREYDINKTDGDRALRRMCKNVGLTVKCTDKSVCQHIGFISSCHMRARKKDRAISKSLIDSLCFNA
ncbi:MAG: hypothetical protein GF411_14155 [Candidatus Lokiarchaeota archaeon]|nr:hypothetical protein [Candidatus Lokiarchaeota archaeon]